MALGAAGQSQAQGKLDATYTAALAGLPIGAGRLTVDIGRREYEASGSGRVAGLLQILSTYAGTVTARGHVNHDRNRDQLAPDVYRASVNSGTFDYDVRMVLQSGTVKDLMAEPPLLPAPDRIPVTDTHRRGVLDPVSAVIMPASGNGEVASPAACERTIPIFDGHQRFNLVLSYKRLERVKAQTGYEGPAVVCSLNYQPIAGHRPGRFAVRYLQEQRDMEIWLAPIAGTRSLAPFRVSVPTLLGNAVVEASSFVTIAETAPPKAPNSSARHTTHASRPAGPALDATRPAGDGPDATAGLVAHPANR